MTTFETGAAIEVDAVKIEAALSIWRIAGTVDAHTISVLDKLCYQDDAVVSRSVCHVLEEIGPAAYAAIGSLDILVNSSRATLRLDALRAIASVGRGKLTGTLRGCEFFAGDGTWSAPTSFLPGRNCQ